MSISEVTPLRSTIPARLVIGYVVEPFGVESEGQSLESVTKPLTAVSE